MEKAVLECQSSLRMRKQPKRTLKSVPCKLNNVKTNYNTLDNLNCLRYRVNEF